MPLKIFPSHLHMTGNMFVDGNSYPVACSMVFPAQRYSNISLCIHTFNNSLLSNYYGSDTTPGTEDTEGTILTGVCSQGTLIQVGKMGNKQIRESQNRTE